MSDQEKKTCCICLEILSEDCSKIRLSCTHEFHGLCIENLQRQCESACPLCRKQFSRTTPIELEDVQHWKIFRYGSEMFIQWISEFETLQSPRFHIELENFKFKLVPQQTFVNHQSLTEFWWSTKQVAKYTSQWLQREYPVFVNCEDVIYNMLKTNSVDCQLSLTSPEFMFIFDGRSIFYSCPQSQLFCFISSKIQNRFCIRQQKRWRMAGLNQYKETFQTMEQLVNKIVEVFTMLQTPFPKNMHEMINYLVHHPDFDDFVMEETKYPLPSIYEVQSVLGFEFIESQYKDWSWVVVDDLWDFKESK